MTMIDINTNVSIIILRANYMILKDRLLGRTTQYKCILRARNLLYILQTIRKYHKY